MASGGQQQAAQKVERPASGERESGDEPNNNHLDHGEDTLKRLLAARRSHEGESARAGERSKVAQEDEVAVDQEASTTKKQQPASVIIECGANESLPTSARALEQTRANDKQPSNQGNKGNEAPDSRSDQKLQVDPLPISQADSNSNRVDEPSKAAQDLQQTIQATSTNSANHNQNHRKQLANQRQGIHNHNTNLDNSNSNEQQDSPEFCKRRLSYLQSLLLRKWPCLALGICIMSSLLFGMILSALTVYLMHGVTDCSGLAALAAANSPLHPAHELIRHLEQHSGGASDEAWLTSAADASNRLHQTAEGGFSAELTSGEGEQRRRFRRLPNSLLPVHYDLFVQPYIAEPFNFSGKVSIRIKCVEASDNITLHTHDLELTEKTLSLKVAAQANSSGSRSAPKIKALAQDKELQFSIIQLDSALEPGQEYVLGIDFTGWLNDDLAGFYKIKYEKQNSREITWIAATQFQATDARRAFPCFDEPHFKATFSIQIKHWKNMTALSNMPIIDRQDSPDGLWTTDTFGISHRMSTYLVAYAVTNFESRSEGNISVWTRPGFAHTAEYALKIAGKILRHYEDFFGIEYPLPKMDMIALPDFNAGAMENWGLITYRETAMLFDEIDSSISNKQRVAVVVAHELAHQWFGNLVTPKWWDDLWLNEGFASYVEYIGVDHVEPGWQMLNQFAVEEVQNVFKLDGLSSSHQISIPVNNPDEISEIFDHISYAKGASIIRMMNYFLTESVFKAGLRRYLRALKYSNAEQSDLWAHLTEAQRLQQAASSIQPIDVEKVMNSWTLQTGFPLVTLKRQYNGSRVAELEQVRYQPYRSLNSSSSLHQNDSKSNNSSARWEIPITFTWKSEQNWEPKTRLWMHQNDNSVVKLNSSNVPKNDNEWMIVNLNQVGYYRVNYDLQNWKLLIKQLDEDHKQIPPISRAQIFDDIFELAKSGSLDYRFVMEATRYLKNERDFLPWEAALMSFNYIDDMLQRTPLYGDWRDYIKDLMEPFYARYKNLDWTRGKDGGLKAVLTNKSPTNESSLLVPQIDNNDVLEQYNQVNAIAWACQDLDHCIQKAKQVFGDWKSSGKNQILPALRFNAYCTAIENGNKEDWDFLWRQYEREQNSSERDRLLRALGCSKEIWLLARYLDWTFDKSKPIRRQDGAYVFRTIAKNNYGRDIAFNFMRERWSTIKEYYGKTSFSLGNLIRSFSNSMSTQIELQQLIAFYESIKVDVGTGRRSFQIAIEEVEGNVQWHNRNYKVLEQWIKEERASKVSSPSAP